MTFAAILIMSFITVTLGFGCVLVIHDTFFTQHKKNTHRKMHRKRTA